MPPKKTAPSWGEDHKQAILKGFREQNLDPKGISGKKINSILKSASTATKTLLQPYFSVSEGGTKANNNALYQHYKDLGCEFVVERTRAGW
jgi:hypothetical protein